jgi:hypothetical protein
VLSNPAQLKVSACDWQVLVLPPEMLSFESEVDFYIDKLDRQNINGRISHLSWVTVVITVPPNKLLYDDLEGSETGEKDKWKEGRM